MNYKLIKNSKKRNTSQKPSTNLSLVPAAYTSQQGRIAGFPRFNHNDIFPPMQRLQFNYTEFFTITGSATVGLIGTTKKFLLNGLYDPSVTGNDAYGYGNILSSGGPYRRYKVVGCKVRVTAVAPNPCYLFTQLRNVIDTYDVGGDTMQNAAEKPGVRTDFIPSTGSQSRTITINLPTLAPLFNWDNNTFNVDFGQTSGPFNGLPGSSPYLLLGAIYPTVASRALDCKVEIMFDTVVYDRETFA